MSESLKEKKEVFLQSARVSQRRYTLEPKHSLPEREMLPEENSVRGEAYRLAIANRHKPWARRYLRSRNYL